MEIDSEFLSFPHFYLFIYIQILIEALFQDLFVYFHHVFIYEYILFIIMALDFPYDDEHYDFLLLINFKLSNFNQMVIFSNHFYSTNYFSIFFKKYVILPLNLNLLKILINFRISECFPSLNVYFCKVMNYYYPIRLLFISKNYFMFLMD